jgi:hypothetical protein
MSLASKTIAARLALWLTAGGGLEELRERDATSRHINEIMQAKWPNVPRVARWRPTRREMLEASVNALIILRDSRIVSVSQLLMLQISIRKTRFPVISSVALSSIEARLERDVHRFGTGGPTPPEIFIYGARRAGAVSKWLSECVPLQTDDVMLKGLLLAAVWVKRIAKPSATGTVSTDELLLVAQARRPRPRIAARARAA